MVFVAAIVLMAAVVSVVAFATIDKSSEIDDIPTGSTAIAIENRASMSFDEFKNYISKTPYRNWNWTATTNGFVCDNANGDHLFYDFLDNMGEAFSKGNYSLGFSGRVGQDTTLASFTGIVYIETS